MRSYGYNTIIRLRRKGRYKYPVYDIVVVQKGKKSRSGFLDRVGFYNPMCLGSKSIIFLDLGKIGFWLYRGATFYGRGRSYRFAIILCFYVARFGRRGSEDLGNRDRE